MIWNCIGWFGDLGWSHAPSGANLERQHYAQVILIGRLQRVLARLNPELPDEALAVAARRLNQYSGQSLVEANREIYTWLRDGIPVEVDHDGYRRRRRQGTPPRWERLAHRVGAQQLVIRTYGDGLGNGQARVPRPSRCAGGRAETNSPSAICCYFEYLRGSRDSRLRSIAILCP